MVDIGVNLGDRRFAPDREAVVQRARAAGVDRLLLTGTSLPRSHAVAELAASQPGVLFATAGVHPHDAKTVDAHTLPALAALLDQPHVVAVGECGLDYDRDFSPRPVQRAVFADQLALARDVGKPLFLHCRAAFADFEQLFHAHAPGHPGVLHCFTGNGDELDRALALGLHIGITGWICDERRGLELKALAPRIPLDRLLVETDAPYLVPRSLRPKPRGGRNEPAFLPHIVEVIAQALGQPVAAVAAASTANAERLFGI
ncbi:MAG: TatD family hydrolase [Myxococcales bacterium]|nr:TatD family hydrolase [Myxococcales bacterium]